MLWYTSAEGVVGNCEVEGVRGENLEDVERTFQLSWIAAFMFREWSLALQES